MSRSQQASIGDALIFMTKAALGICLIAAGAWIYVAQTQVASKQAVDDAYLRGVEDRAKITAEYQRCLVACVQAIGFDPDQAQVTPPVGAVARATGPWLKYQRKP